MLAKSLLGIIFVGALAFDAAAADIVVRVRPPRAIAERRVARPGRNYVWIPGYQRYQGNSYVWTPGRWDAPPRRNARWVQHRWVHRRDGWVFVEGHWR